jgi:stage V sporulation protein R
MTKYLWTDSEWTFDRIKACYDACEDIAINEMKLDVYKNQIEVISSEQMLDAYASIGMPIYYHHWSFGKHFVQESDSYKKGHSGLAYELVINSNPCINYLMEDNTMTTQCLVIAHAAFGHNHFFKNNYLFKQWTDADAIVDYLIFARDYVAEQEERHGRVEVEQFLDSCHALMNYGVNRYKRPTKLSLIKEQERQKEREEYLQQQVSELYRILPQKTELSLKSEDEKFPQHPEENILYFCEKYSPRLKPWQRELIRIVRKIAQYFYPQGQTKVMNEGFASLIHYKIMNRLHEKGLTTDGAHLEFLGLHANVLYQPSFDQRGYSGFNPYKLGFEILRDIERICTKPTSEDRDWFPNLIGQDPMDVIKDAVANFRDESFIRQYLSPKVMRDFRMFHVHDNRRRSFYKVESIHNDNGYQDIRDTLANSYERHNYMPQVEITEVNKDSQELSLRFTSYRQRGILAKSPMIIHLRRLWGRDVVLRDENNILIRQF